jgi:hypothetical protein
MGSISTSPPVDFTDHIPYNPPILPGCILTAFNSTLKMEADFFVETLVYSYKFTTHETTV